MTAVKVGDRVRATCGESVIVGEVTQFNQSGVLVVIDGDGYGSRWLRQIDWTAEVLAPPIPDVVGTIVRDRDGDAWQRQEYAWYLADDDDSAYSLDRLQILGPLIVLWTPEDKS